MSSKKNELAVIEIKPTFNVTVGGVKLPDEDFKKVSEKNDTGFLTFSKYEGLFCYESTAGWRIYTDAESKVNVESMGVNSELIIRESKLQVSRGVSGNCELSNADVTLGALSNSKIINRKKEINGRISYTTGGPVKLDAVIDSTLSNSSVLVEDLSYDTITKSNLFETNIRSSMLHVESSHLNKVTLGAGRIYIKCFTIHDSIIRLFDINLISSKDALIKEIAINLDNDFAEEGTFGYTDHLISEEPVEKICLVGKNSFDIFRHLLGRFDFTFFRTRGRKLYVIAPSGKIMLFGIEDKIEDQQQALLEGLQFEWVEQRQEVNPFQDQLVSELLSIIRSRLNIIQMIESMSQYI